MAMRLAATGAQVLVTMLPDGRAVRSALLGRKGAARSLAPGSAVIDMSSSDPMATRVLGDELAARGLRFLDAPVSGRVDGARNGTLTIMAGGDAATPRRSGACARCWRFSANRFFMPGRSVPAMRSRR